MTLEIEQHDVAPLRLPWVTLALVIACGVILAIAETNTRLAETSLLAWGVVPSDFAPIKALTHVFFHAHLPHLLGSLALLVLVGVPLESRWSALFYVPLVATGAMASGSAYAWRTPESSIPMVGMAGVVATLMGACLVRFRRGLPITWYRPGTAGMQAIQLTLPVVVLLPIWFLGEVAGSFGQFDGVTRGLGYWGQLGGLLAGALVAGLVEWSGLEGRIFGEAQVGRPAGPHPAIQSALMARENGNLNEALSILEDAVKGGANDSLLIVHYWEMASFAGKPQQAAPVLTRLIERELACGERQSGANHWCELVQRVRHLEAPPRLLLQLTPLLLALDHEQEAVKTLVLAACSPELTPGMALRVVDLAQDVDAPSTLRAARIALTSADLHETKRTRLQELSRELSARGIREAELPEDEVEDRSLELAEDDFRPPVITSSEVVEAPEDGFALSSDGSLVDRGFGKTAAESPAAAARPPAPAAAPPPLPDPEESLDPHALDPEEVPGTPGLALHGLDLEADEMNDVASLIDETPSTGVDLGGLGGLDELDDTGVSLQSSYSSEDDDDDDITGPIPEEPSNAFDAIAMDAAYDEARFSDAKIVDAIPTDLAPDRLGLQQPGGRRGHVEFGKVDAISVAAVQGLAEKPVVLLDMLANWTSLEGGMLRIIRLRSDQFDARSLVPDAPDSVEAFKMLSQILLEQCAAVALPDPLAAIGQPFRVCERLSDYEREILQLER